MPKTTPMSVIKPDQVLILHIEFKWIKPSIWRRVAVPENITLSKLHQVIQAVFGWSDTHLHEFEIDGESYGVPDPDWGPPVISEQRKKLINVLYGKKTFRYVYDFGDNWELRIKVEKTLPAIIFAQVPCCIDGANRRPPEDIGGAPGYETFLAALADPNHPEHEEMSEWYGGDGFDPTAFDCDWVNQWLKKQVKT
ncbi:plasmid pRiA4b ORF-3 family protein [Pseudomonas sp. SWRI102]|uniref:Plasmid pRiA4b ORF-3 family protein n=1 Tax=Pseudomonas marvdashtae TaxID=2745500 RepID=A0A923FQ66_9PSED|nr:plasmid pRiA4b ORF-3 family protein [Pseudomonas marvdashtae]MBV4553838.1 plasmid pRiA4b ORF-3 family protein [Pseudomonas marvdashtae]